MERPRTITLRFLAEPSDVNFGGKVHGGAVMKWFDQAGYTCAVGWTGTYCVTAYVGGIHFLGPVHVGELVELRATVIRTGRTSLDVAVDAYASDPRSQAPRRTGHCVMVFVALDSAGAPTVVEGWEPKTELDQVLMAYAERLAANRREIDTALDTELARYGLGRSKD